MKPFLLALLIVLGSAFAPGVAVASVPSVCVSIAAELTDEGLDDTSLATAWALEVRKRSLSMGLSVVRGATTCPSSSRLMASIDAKGTLSLGDSSQPSPSPGPPARSVAAVQLLEFESWERSSEVARVLAGAVAVSGAATADPLGTVHRRMPPPPTEPDSVPLRLGLEIGGVYLPQAGPGSHRGAAELALGLGLLDQRQLTLALRASWQPLQDLVGAAAPSRWQAVEVGVDVQLRFPIGRWALGLGMQLGAEFRSVQVDDPSRLSPVEASDTGFVATVAALADYELTTDLHLTIVAGARVQVNRTAYVWLGDPLYTGPLVTGIVGVRLGWWFL